MHLANHYLAHEVDFRFRHVEVEFVVYLHYHLRVQLSFCQSAVDTHHGEFDDVGGGALYGCVDGVAFGEGAHGGIARVDVGQIAASAEHSLGVAAFTCQLFATLDILYHGGEGGEVVVDELFGFRT